MIFKPIQEIIDWITPQEVGIVTIEITAEHLARVEQRFKERRAEMGENHLLHPKHHVQRKDGKVYGKKDAADNVRPMRKNKVAA